MPPARSLRHLLLSLMVEDLKAPKEILALPVFLGEMVTLVPPDTQVRPVLPVPPESVSHVLLAHRTILHSLTPMMSSLE